METNENLNGKNTLIKILKWSTLSTGLFFLISIIFHITPFKMMEEMSNFATHHYFLTSFVGLVIFLILAKNYFSIKDQQVQLNKQSQFNPLRINRIKLKKMKAGIANRLKAIKANLQARKKIEASKRKYDNYDVLINSEDKKTREERLIQAMKLGNAFKQYVKLTFKQSNLNKQIESIVLYVNNDHVTLKGGIVIPVKSIYKIEI